MSCVLVLLMIIGVVVEVVTVGCIYPSIYIGGEVTRMVIELVTT
jgi:hypothetical protein